MQDSYLLLERIKDYRPESPVGNIQAFIDSTLHKDYQNEVMARIEQMRDVYEDCDSKSYIETRGGIKVMRLMLDIFDYLLENKKSDLEGENHETEI